jgi:hypothetical protein
MDYGHNVRFPDLCRITGFHHIQKGRNKPVSCNCCKSILPRYRRGGILTSETPAQGISENTTSVPRKKGVWVKEAKTSKQ